MRYTSILKNKLILILSMLFLTAPLLAQDEDTTIIIEEKKAIPGEEGSRVILQLEMDVKEGTNSELEINIERKIVNVDSPRIEIPKKMNNQKLLLSLLRDKDPGVRAVAAKALGEFGDQEAAPYLSEILKKDKNSYVRYNAAWALGEIGGKESLSVLKKALKRKKNRQIKEMIEMSIKKIESGHSISPEVRYQNFLRRKR